MNPRPQQYSSKVVPVLVLERQLNLIRVLLAGYVHANIDPGSIDMLLGRYGDATTPPTAVDYLLPTPGFQLLLPIIFPC